MEKTAVSRLNYYFEYHCLLHSYPTRFRKQKSITDALIRFIMKEVMVAVFLDIEKAYDTMWSEELLIKFVNMGIKGRMYNYLLDFLSQLTLRVRVGEAKKQKNSPLKVEYPKGV